jgi:hypothetical protein
MKMKMRRKKMSEDILDKPPAPEGDDQNAKEGAEAPALTENDLEDAEPLDDDEDDDDEADL